MRTNVLIATFGVMVFGLVTLTSGRVDIREGLGWDGAAYAQMVTGSLSDGSPNTMVRPLVVLAARVPFALGVGVIGSFQIVNYLSAFLLYLSVCLLLQREGATTQIRTVVIANLACCIATSKMFAYYPVLIDFGALAMTTAAFYFAGTDRRWAAGVTAALAAASREFGIAAAIYGVHRSIRQGRSWRETAAVYLPAFVLMAAIRVIVVRSTPPDDIPLSLADAVSNLSLWTSPAFIGFFVYFSVVVFGGISAMLVVQLRSCGQRLRTEPELATFAVVIVAAAAGGSLDIWRYLAFGLPVAVVLIGHTFRRADDAFAYGALFVMTFMTMLTQRPFEQMNTSTYFRDWFPLYEYLDQSPSSGNLIEIWRTRMLSLALLLFAVWLFMRRTYQSARAAVSGPSAVQSQPQAG